MCAKCKPSTKVAGIWVYEFPASFYNQTQSKWGLEEKSQEKGTDRTDPPGTLKSNGHPASPSSGSGPRRSSHQRERPEQGRAWLSQEQLPDRSSAGGALWAKPIENARDPLTKGDRVRKQGKVLENQVVLTGPCWLSAVLLPSTGRSTTPAGRRN